MIICSEDSVNCYLQLNDSSQHIHPLLYKWSCPVCNQRFKYDTQLARHQIKYAHDNPDRQQRKYNRGRKTTKRVDFSCEHCGEFQQTRIDLLNHRQWCLNGPNFGSRARYYASSWEHATFQCRFHEIPYYYSSIDQLKRHISTHKPKAPIIEINCQTPKQRKRPTLHDIQKLNKEFRKYTKLSLRQAQNIAFAKGLTVNTIRRYYRKFKKNHLQPNLD